MIGTDITVLLSTDEQTALVTHEATIERGLRTFNEVGEALMAIRDQRLYRAEFGTFEEYAEERWGFTRSRAYRLIDAFAVSELISSPIGDKVNNEAQARELAPLLDDPDELREVWTEAVQRAEGKPTAAVIREVRREREEPPRPAPTPAGQREARASYLAAESGWTPPSYRPPPEPVGASWSQIKADMAKQEYLNAYSQAIDGLIYIESYTQTYTPPNEIPERYPSIDAVIGRIENLLATWRNWKESNGN